MERNEDVINLSRLFGVIMERWRALGSIVLLFTILALVTSFLLPPKYESTALVQTRNSGNADTSGAAAALATLGGGGTSSPTLNYIELMKSRTVLEPIIESLDFPTEKKPEAKSFAKKYLDIKNTKGTNVIEVSATWGTPDGAQQIAQGVVDNFLLMQTDMNRETQSFLLKFLDKRIEESKDEAESAEEKMLAFSKEHKLYSPNEQVGYVVKEMQAFDKSMADFEVQIKSVQADLDAAEAALSEKKLESKIYNISDNEIVHGLRSSIVGKQVELVGLEQYYTDQHPSVEKARNELKQLQNSLAAEVAAAVDSNSVTLNPTQSELLKREAMAKVNLSVAKASKAALEDEWKKKESAFSQLPDDVLEYIRLQRNSTIKNEVYLNLVKQSEQTRLQRAVESMDIQIVDSANLPDEDEPVAPKKLLITLLGTVVGVLFAAGYSLLVYRREA